MDLEYNSSLGSAETINQQEILLIYILNELLSIYLSF